MSGDSLTLLAYVTAEIGKGRPFNMATDSHWLNIDTTETVYPIRGSYTVWKCNPSDYLGTKTDRNCLNKAEEPHAEGYATRILLATGTVQ